MNAGNSYDFQQLVELCKQTHQEITQTMSAEFGVKRKIFPPKLLKEAKSTTDFQAYTYHSGLTEDAISQQSADQLTRSTTKPVEFDGFRMQSKLFDFEPEKGESS